MSISVFYFLVFLFLHVLFELVPCGRLTGNETSTLSFPGTNARCVVVSFPGTKVHGNETSRYRSSPEHVSGAWARKIRSPLISIFITPAHRSAPAHLIFGTLRYDSRFIQWRRERGTATVSVQRPRPGESGRSLAPILTWRSLVSMSMNTG